MNAKILLTAMAEAFASVAEGLPEEEEVKKPARKSRAKKPTAEKAEAAAPDEMSASELAALRDQARQVGKILSNEYEAHAPASAALRSIGGAGAKLGAMPAEQIASVLEAWQKLITKFEKERLAASAEEVEVEEEEDPYG